MGFSGEIPLGSYRGIPIRLHVLFLVVLGISVAVSATGGKWWCFYTFLLMGPVLLITIVIHELGHALATRQVGGEAHGILLWPLGGLAFIGHSSGPKADLWVSFAGPLTHVPMIIIWCFGMLLATKMAMGRAYVSLWEPYPLMLEDIGVALCAGAIKLNLGLFLFNLLVPAYPLDGGRILADLLLMCGVAPPTAAKIMVGVAAPIAVGIVIWGAFVINVVLIMIGVWILYSTYQLFDTIRKGQVDQHPMFSFNSSSSSNCELPMTAPGPYPGQPGPYQPSPSYPGAPPPTHGPTPGTYQQYQVDPRFQI